jgi:hypothetical protein
MKSSILLRGVLFIACILCCNNLMAQNDDEEDAPRGWPGGINVSAGYTNFSWKHQSLNRLMSNYNTQVPNVSSAFGNFKWSKPISVGAEFDAGLISIAYYRHFAEGDVRAVLVNGGTANIKVKTPSNDFNIYMMLPLNKIRAGIMAGYTMQNLTTSTTYLRGASDTGSSFAPPIMVSNFKTSFDRTFSFGGRIDYRPIKYVSVSVEYNHVGLFQKQDAAKLYTTQPFVRDESIPVVNNDVKYLPEKPVDVTNSAVYKDGTGEVASGLFQGGRLMVRVNFYPWSWY